MNNINLDDWLIQALRLQKNKVTKTTPSSSPSSMLCKQYKDIYFEILIITKNLGYKDDPFLSSLALCWLSSSRSLVSTLVHCQKNVHCICISYMPECDGSTRYGTQIFFGNGTCTFFRDHFFSGYSTFSGTKLFRYRFRYFSSGPDFSGTGIIKKGAKFSGLGCHTLIYAYHSCE